MTTNSECCARMAEELTKQCEEHSDPYDCPDVLVSPVRGGYGLIIRDGGNSVIQISFCPWCGSRLPTIGNLD